MNSLPIGRVLPLERHQLELAPNSETLPLELAGCVLAALNRALPFACLLFDSSGRCLWINQRAAHLLGRDASDQSAPLAEIVEQVRRVARQGELDPSVSGSAKLGKITCQLLAVPVWPEPLVMVSIAPRREAHNAEALRTLGLSRREGEVARLATQGFSVLNMAARMGVAESTVKTHLRRLYRKLKVCTRAELTAVLLDPERAAHPARAQPGGPALAAFRPRTRRDASR